jgi:mono/diheme cytochrome c family protein
MQKLFFTTTMVAAFGLASAHAAATVDFTKEIQPIFQKSCLQCHGPEKQKGGLRLDSKDATFKGGKDGQVIIAGHADKSDLYRRVILTENDDDVMPSKGDLLTKAQTDLIKQWINEGAVWPEGTIIAEAEKPEAAVSSPFSDLTPFKPAPAETAAIAKLTAAGTDVRLVAANVTWREANFHTQGAKINDASIAPLKDVASLVDLNLSGTKVTDAGLQNIANLTNLVYLHLDHTQVTDAGLANLAKLKHLYYLNLYATGITDAGLNHLKELKGLKRLYLWQTKVTGPAALALEKELPGLFISRGWENEPAAKEVAAKPEMKPEVKQEAKK